MGTRAFSDRSAVKDISYATSAQSRSGRALIRVVENTTGRIGLIKRARGYEDEVAQGRDFWAVMAERYGLSLNVVGGSMDNIPAKGPLIVVSNHPYGILDGLILGHILSERRGDFRIIAHRVFRRAKELDRVILPISFDETKEAQRTNIATRRTALEYLGQGGAIGIFPGGTVSTAQRPFGQPMDPTWRSFTAKMIAKSGATVVPLFFTGTNSRLFQIASHLHYTLRMALLINEFRTRTDTPVDLVVGEPIPQDQIAAFAGDNRGLMDFVREKTYALSPTPLDPQAKGFEFEEQHRR